MKILKKLMTLIPNKGAVRSYVNYVNACDKWITYTDGFKLVRIPNPTSLRGTYTKDGLNKYVVAGCDEGSAEITFPDAENVMPDENKLTLKIDVNAKFLIDILRVLSVGSKDNRVRIHIDPEYPSQIVLVTNGDSEGLIVPLLKDTELN